MVCHTEPKVFIPSDHLYSVKMLLPDRRCGWDTGVGHNILSLYIIALLFPVATVLVQSTSPSTNFSYPVFGSADDFLTFGETRHSSDALSFTVKPGPLTRRLFIKLFHKDKVQMKSRESNRLASLSTSFTFSITQSEEQFANRTGWLGLTFGFMFNIVSQDISTLFGKHVEPGKNSINYLGVEFDTYNNFITKDPSDNHIGVNINNLKSAYTFNLCEGEQITCSFPWTNRVYTAWIDINGLTGSLEVWFANGSLRDGVVKPAGSGLIKVPKLDLMDIIEDYMYVGFSCNSGPFLDTYEIISWNMATSYTKEDKPTLLSKRILVICAACAPAILAATCLLVYWTRQPSSNNSSKALALDLNLMGVRRFTFKELKKATRNFHDSALIGKGGFGSVYKGTLTPSGMVIAVKRLRHDSEHVRREFLAEVSSISQIRHRNLVHLQGWCHEDDQFLLVFEYLSNGSLDEWLFPSRRRYPRDPKYKRFEVLPWELRFSILAGVAAAVEYLHEEWVQCVLHRDIKSSNVMLDVDFNPHLGDFGLARLIDHDKLEKTTVMAGTFGYIAPEMYHTGKATKESDVYSFGILMLEVLCGKKPVKVQVEDPNENSMLLQDVWRAYEDGNILRALDPGLLKLHLHQLNNPTTHPTDSISEVCCTNPAVSTGATVNFREEGWVMALLQLGLQCCLSDPESRPSMRVVKQVIRQLLQSSTVEDDPTVALQWMSPVPSTMPLLGGSLTATKVSLEKVEAQLSSETCCHVGVRRRFATN